MTQIAKSVNKIKDNSKETSDVKGRLLESKGAKQPDESDLFTMIASLIVISIILLAISRLLQ